MDSVTIDYIKLAKEIAKQTPQPQNEAEWTIYGLMIAVLIVTNVASWMYFMWEKKQHLERDAKTTATMEKVKETMDRLIVYFDQNSIKDDIQNIKTNIALINQTIQSK